MNAFDTEYVATLVASAPGGLLPLLLKDTAIHMRKSGGKSIRTGWLAEAQAGDIFCVGFAPDTLRALLAAYLGGKAVDFIVQPVATRRKKLLVADMESTIIEQEMLDELADVLGRREEVAEITRRAMNGEIDFAGALRARVGLLKGQPATILDQAASRITLMPGAEVLLAGMKREGATCWLVSGGFTCFVEPVAARLGFDRSFANTLAVRDGVLTGEVAEPILDKNAKKTLLEKACAEHGFALQDSLTAGDGANDIPMLSACNQGGGLGVAYHAKPNVREAVPNQINHADLRALLFAQGHGTR